MRLTESPAIVTSQLSPHLRKMMKSMMQGQDSPNQAMPVTLEVNPKHHLITTLAMVLETNLAVARVSVQQIYDTAMIAAGMIEEPKASSAAEQAAGSVPVPGRWLRLPHGDIRVYPRGG